MTNEKKMTKAEMFTLIADLLADNEDVVAFCDHEIELLSKKRTSKSSKPSKTQIENEPIKASIIEYLNGKSDVIASDVAKELEISTSKASALLRQIVADDKATVKDVKISTLDKDGHKKTKVCKAYTLA